MVGELLFASYALLPCKMKHEFLLHLQADQLPIPAHTAIYR
jgi:hypothetical protein